MKHRGIARIKTRGPLVSLFLILGTLIMSACAATQGGRINPVEQANLRDTVKIEVMAFDPDAAETTSPYVQLLAIPDAQVIDQVVWPHLRKFQHRPNDVDGRGDVGGDAVGGVPPSEVSVLPPRARAPWPLTSPLRGHPV